MLRSTHTVNSKELGVISSGDPSKRLMLVISPSGMPECLSFAVEHEFDAVEVTHVASFQSAGLLLPRPVALVLVDVTMIKTSASQIEQFVHANPSTPVAVMVDDDRDVPWLYEWTAEFGLIRGVLPMHLKLDVWLSVVGLLLRGGDYFPAAALRRRDGNGAARNGAAHPAHDVNYAEPAGHALIDARRPTVDLAVLTDREFQVLESVARGTQNKLIAAELGLSEHTIKIHIHNIIHKLHTRNRTEAAALFLKSMSLEPNVVRRMRLATSPR